MKGQDVFTPREIAEIKYILQRLRVSQRSEQKRLRDSLRNMGFYITDFDNSYRGFDLDKFEQLIKSGKITILDRS